MSETSVKELEYRLQVAEQERMRLKKRLTGISRQDQSSVLSMLDMMTLLLLFFIMLYVKSALTQVQVEIPATVPPPSIAPTPVPQIPAPGPAIAATEQPVAPAQPSPDPELIRLREEIADFMKQEAARGTALGFDQRRLVFVLGERITFNLGQAELLTDFEQVLIKISDIIARKPEYRILVSGHTDDRPINTPWFPSNWELSAARAIAVAKFLANHGIGPDRITIQGFGEYQPMVPNTSTENRQANRRVEIRMVRHSVEEAVP